METNKTPSRIHPLVAAASASVILVSLVGVAAITGILPTSHGTVAPAAPVAAMTTPAQDAPVGTAPAAAAAASAIKSAAATAVRWQRLPAQSAAVLPAMKLKSVPGLQRPIRYAYAWKTVVYAHSRTTIRPAGRWATASKWWMAI